MSTEWDCGGEVRLVRIGRAPGLVEYLVVDDHPRTVITLDMGQAARLLQALREALPGDLQ